MQRNNFNWIFFVRSLVCSRIIACFFLLLFYCLFVCVFGLFVCCSMVIEPHVQLEIAEKIDEGEMVFCSLVSMAKIDESVTTLRCTQYLSFIESEISSDKNWIRNRGRGLWVHSCLVRKIKIKEMNSREIHVFFFFLLPLFIYTTLLCQRKKKISFQWIIRLERRSHTHLNHHK